MTPELRTVIRTKEAVVYCACEWSQGVGTIHESSRAETLMEAVRRYEVACDEYDRS